jgi:trehalose 6-phosphate phosphatase
LIQNPASSGVFFRLGCPHREFSIAPVAGTATSEVPIGRTPISNPACAVVLVCYGPRMTIDLPAIRADATALFLDVDGTLLEIVSRPSDVVADEQLIETLEALHGLLDGALSLVSGRSLTEIDRVFAPAVFNAAGSHGAELRLRNRPTPLAEPEPMPRPSVERLASFADRYEGLLLEHKRGGVSLHYRGAPSLEGASREAAERELAELGDDFRLIAGKMVFEIARRGHDKGEAIRRFLTEAPFAGRTPMFVGDDVTDEDGFRVANELGGASIRVGGSDGSEARHALADVAAVRRWLAAALAGT